jgi:hypothetical protein
MALEGGLTRVGVFSLGKFQHAVKFLGGKAYLFGAIGAENPERVAVQVRFE